MRLVIVVLILVLWVPVAHAQSTFVSASVVGEVARFSFIEAEPILGSVDTNVDGESVGFGLAIERALGERWGVALQFARPGAMSGEDTYELPISIAIFPPLPPVEVRRTFEQERYSWNTLAWFAQPLGDRME